MFKPNKLAKAVALALILPGAALAEFEVSGEAKIEYDLFTLDGVVTGAQKAHKSGDPLKTEGSVKLFINADVGEESAFHAELLLADDGEAASNRLQGGESYTQYEILREFYFDTNAGGWDFRLGKQQVVWGTADGIKLLDIINPTDYRELNQNVSEDARIPVWMINAERDFDSGANIQFIISEAQPNFIAGLDKDGDTGAPFIFKGVDTITGKTNGFLNIASDMGKTSGVFETLLQMGGLGSITPGVTSALAGGPMGLTTVAGFTSLGTGAPFPTFQQVGQQLQGPGGTQNGLAVFPGPIQSDPNQSLLNAIFLPFMNNLQTGNNVLGAAANGSGDLLNQFAGYMGQLQAGLQTGTADGASFTNTSTAILDINGDGLADTTTVQTALGAIFGMMKDNVYNALGAQGVDTTDDALVAGVLSQGSGLTVTAADVTGMTPVYQQAVQAVALAGMKQTFFSNSTTNQFDGTLSPDKPTSAFDYMANTTFATFTNFIGMKTEYRKSYKTDPFSETNLAFRYKNSTDGGTNFSLNYAYRMDSNPYVEIHWEDKNGDPLTVNELSFSMDALGQPRTNPDGTSNGNPNPEAYTVTTLYMTDKSGALFDSQYGMNPATLVFEEKLNRVSTIGASFDTAIDTESVPVVVRGEFSYDVGTKQPVIDKARLAIGDLTGALKMGDADMFKYVLGVDVTVLTNLMVSTQLIQFYNLDYINESKTCTAASGVRFDCSRYTGDFSSMHLSNGLKKGDEVETFISFFLSKPFGSDGEHRWNNILIAENDGGYWDRFDIEYSFNDDMIGTIEFNKYWGDENTMFGQFEKSSNLQLGFKYIF